MEKLITPECLEKITVEQERIAKLETKVESIQEDVKEVRDDIKELHSRITTVDRNLSDKLELTERRIMEEIKSLRDDIAEHNKAEDKQISKILEWKWMAAGGIVVLAWLLSHINIVSGLGKLFG